jgi:lactate dehydrogenase-like 2-hydroxyacid dehydrogenase
VILEGKTALVLGLGEVGKRVAQGCRAMVSRFCRDYAEITPKLHRIDTGLTSN